MAGNKKYRDRIEPTFDGQGSRDKPSSGRRPSKGKKKTKARRGGLVGLIRFMAYWCIVLGIWGTVAVAGVVVYYGSKMPAASSWAIPDRPPNVKIMAVDGTVLANRGPTGGEALTLDEMSPYIPMAVISIEDRRFYSHFGIDPIGLARAMVTNVLTGHMVQGGSTLTQQLAKNLFLSPERTLERKVQEVLLALWLEHKFSKDQILAMYLNRVYFGANSYGVEAASRRYFNKSARDVNLAEAATLAGLLKAPSRLSPATNPDGAKARAQVVLGAMKDAGYITDSEIKTAMNQEPAQAKHFWSGASHYAADMVMDELKTLVGDVNQDLVVDTTIDPTLEKAAGDAIATAIDKNGKKLDVEQGALVSIDGTGAIRALVGGKDYSESQYNRAWKAKRQPGSAFKPFVYATALEQGDSPDSIRNDAPVKIGNWTPENYEKKYDGPVTLAYALAHSINTVAAQLAQEVGPNNIIKLAHRMGIESELEPNASIALGTSEVSLVELTGAYAAFMNGGYKATPHIIRRVSTTDGKVLYENTYDKPPRVLEPRTVVNMNTMMMGVVNQGTGTAAKLPGWQVAGKTGTTQSYRDALFVGFTSNLTTGVWFGNDDGHSMKRVTGGGLPARTWQQFMAAAHQGLSPAPLYGEGQTVDQQPRQQQQQAPGDQQMVRQDDGIDTLYGLISRVLSGDKRKTDYPPAPVGSADNGSNGGRQPVEEMPQQVNNGGPVPPADVGTYEPPPRAPRKTSLLGIIMGE
jgi:penicillin-binding protein 1A